METLVMVLLIFAVFYIVALKKQIGDLHERSERLEGLKEFYKNKK